MTPTEPRQFFIQGQTLDGRTFRPSDWAERLAGAMSCFRPGGAKGGIGSFIGYSPYCVPRLIDNVKNVIVDERLKALEPMAWDFVMNFARDKTVMLVTHRTSLLTLVDRVIVIDGGKVVADGPRDRIMEALQSGRIARAA